MLNYSNPINFNQYTSVIVYLLHFVPINFSAKFVFCDKQHTIKK